MVSTEEMKTIIPKLNWVKAQTYLPYMNTVLPNFGIDTPLRKAHFLSQLAHESGGLKYSEENLKYSAQGLRSTFGKYFKTNEIAEQYARQPERIANRVYANRMGNGSEESGDGWKFRGRGLIQLTGKELYQNFAKVCGINGVNNPDLIRDAEIALASACWFWRRRNINTYGAADDITMVTIGVNGGKHGIGDRMQWLDSFKDLCKLLDSDSKIT